MIRRQKPFKRKLADNIKKQPEPAKESDEDYGSQVINFTYTLTSFTNIVLFVGRRRLIKRS